MKVTKITPIDAVWCTAETDEGDKHMPIEEAEKLLTKRSTTKKVTKSATKKTRE